MSSRLRVASTSDIPEGESRAYPVEDRMIAIFHHGGQFYAIEDFCPHQGASLACGIVEEGAVACPLHAWRFRLSDGAWLDNPRIQVDAFPTEIDGEDLYILLP